MIHAVQTLVLMIFPALVILGGVRDLVSYRIPNWISLALVGGFALAAGLALAGGAPPGALGLNLAVGAAALAAGVAMFALGWIGGGDAKLFAAAALWLGWPAGLAFAAFTGIAGGGLAVTLLALRSDWVRPYVLTGPAWFSRLARADEAVPYGVAIAIGALCAFPVSTLPGAIGS